MNNPSPFQDAGNKRQLICEGVNRALLLKGRNRMESNLARRRSLAERNKNEDYDICSNLYRLL